MTATFDAAGWRKAWRLRILSRIPFILLAYVCGAVMRSDHFGKGWEWVGIVGYFAFLMLATLGWSRFFELTTERKRSSDSMRLLGIETGYVPWYRTVLRFFQNLFLGLSAAWVELWAAVMRPVHIFLTWRRSRSRV